MDGVDTIALENVHRIEWRIHSWGSIEPLNNPERMAFRICLEQTRYHLSFDAIPGHEVEIFPTAFVPAYPNDGRRDTALLISIHATEAVIRWNLSIESRFI